MKNTTIAFIFLLSICNFISLASESQPREKENWQIILDEKNHLEMIYIEPGSFNMGSPNTELGRNIDEQLPMASMTKIMSMLLIMENIENNNLTERVDGIFSKSLEFKNDGDFCCNDYIVPDRSISAKYRHKYRYVGFQPCAIVLTAFGCRNRCKFCIRWQCFCSLPSVP